MNKCNRVVVQAPGKVNLTLDIVGTDQRGYHLMEMVMLALDLSDLVLIGRRREKGLQITCSDSRIPLDDTNIVHGAVRRFFAYTDMQEQGLSVHIDKLLPMQAGMAGGSADAAAVLVGLNQLFQAGLSQQQLCSIGLECGADVPFCIVGGCCLAQGVGEILTPLPPLPECYFAVAKPPQGMSTRLAFDRFDKAGAELVHPNTQAVLSAIQGRDIVGVGAGMNNVLGQLNLVPEVETLCRTMRVQHALGAVMTGTGTAAIGLYKDERLAMRACETLLQQVQEVHLARPVAHGASVLHCS